MPLVVPTITTDDPAVFEKNLSEFMSFQKRVQVDFSDGTFASTFMVPIESMKIPEEAKIDLHLMTARPSGFLAQIIALKPNLCIIHAEADDDLSGMINQLHSAGIKVGIALLRSTFPGKVQELIAAADHVLIFAGSLGEQGGTMDFLQIEKIPLIRAIKSDLEIGWDGGANLSNIRALAHSGLDVINVGSAITRAADRPAAYQSLLAECEKKGVLV